MPGPGAGWAPWVVAAVLLFWTVGAYNRLVGLRNRLAGLFAPVEAQCRKRHRLIVQLADALAQDGPREVHGAVMLRAASQQVEGACFHAKAQPSDAAAVTSLRLAEQILVEVRTRVVPLLLPVRPAAAPIDAAPAAASDADGSRFVELAAIDLSLAFAKGQFNDAVRAYNAAIGQFPTLIIATGLGFRAAGTL